MIGPRRMWHKTADSRVTQSRTSMTATGPLERNAVITTGVTQRGATQKVVGRFNLYDLVDGTGEVGYRVAQRAAGRGVATSAWDDVCRIAREQYGLRRAARSASGARMPTARSKAMSSAARVGLMVISSTDGGRIVTIAFPGESAAYRAARDRLLAQEIELRRLNGGGCSITAFASAWRTGARGLRVPGR